MGAAGIRHRDSHPPPTPSLSPPLSHLTYVSMHTQARTARAMARLPAPASPSAVRGAVSSWRHGRPRAGSIIIMSAEPSDARAVLSRRREEACNGARHGASQSAQARAVRPGSIVLRRDRRPDDTVGTLAPVGTPRYRSAHARMSRKAELPRGRRARQYRPLAVERPRG